MDTNIDLDFILLMILLGANVIYAMNGGYEK